MNKFFFWLFTLAYIAIITLNFVAGSRDWDHFLGIDKDSIVVKSDIVSEKDTVKITSLSGPPVQLIQVNPNNHNQLIINNHIDCYLSLDHGLTWSNIELNKKIYFAVWINNNILAYVENGYTEDSYAVTSLMASQDFGATWNPVTINTNSDKPITYAEFSENYEASWKTVTLSNLDKKVLSNIAITLNYQGNPILKFSEESQYLFELNNNVLNIKEKYKKTTANPRIYQDDIQFMYGKIPATISVSGDGLWAATLGGVFFKKQDDTIWQDKSASLGNHSFNPNFESQYGNKLLVLDAIGRLAISDNKGKSWKPLAKNVLKAEFINNESILIVHQNGRIVLVDGDDTLELATDWKSINSEISYLVSSLYGKQIYFIQGNEDHIWLTIGPVAYIEEPPVKVSRKEAFSQVFANANVGEVVVYHYNRKQKQWTVKPWSTENKFEIEERCELNFDYYSDIVSINGEETSDYGTAKKVMLIQSGNKYVHFDNHKLHIRKLKNCKPLGVKRVWNFDQIVSPAAYYETDKGLEVFSISYNNTTNLIKINLNDRPPLWRWFFYFFYYQYGVYIIGIGLILWFLKIKRKKQV